jgi:hypothetical protein
MNDATFEDIVTVLVVLGMPGILLVGALINMAIDSLLDRLG